MNGMQPGTTIDDRVTPARKQRTYGRQSRSLDYGRLKSAPRQGLRTTGATSVTKGDKTYKSEANQSTGKRGISELPKTANPKNATPQTPSKGKGNVFDLPSSEDEPQTRTEPWLKRRKLSPSKAESRSDGFDQIVSGKTPQPHKSRKPSRHIDKDGKGFVNKSPVEVVIRTPPKPKTLHGIEQETSDILDISPTMRHSSSQPTSRQMRNGSNMRSSVLPPSTAPRELPIRQPMLRTPFKELRRATKHLSVGSDGKRIREGNTGDKFSTGEHQNYDSATDVTSTSSRKRLVDALGSSHLKKADTPSDSSPSRSPSQSPLPPADRPPALEPEPCSEPQSRNPRRSRPGNLHQAPPSGLKATYARQRSFLDEMDAIGAMGNLDNSGTKNSILSPQEDTAGLGTPSHINTLSTDLDEEKINASGVRSIYELRRSGDNARYHAIIETIFEDIEERGVSVSRKRSGLMQLCSKLVDPKFSHRFLSNALEKRFAKSHSSESDIICGYLIASVYALLLCSGPMSPMNLHMFWTQILKVAPLLLRKQGGIREVANLRETKMSKAGKGDLQDLCVKLEQSKIWPGSPPSKSTPQVMALRCLELAVRKLRETGESPEAMPDSVLHQLIEFLLEDPEKAEINDDLTVLELTFSILESYTIDTLSLGEAQQRALKALSKLGPLLSRLEDRADPRSRHIQILEIRLILNITNNNATLCEEFSTPDFIGALSKIVLSHFRSVEEEPEVVGAAAQKESLLDTVILALGALINLTEWSCRSRRVLLESTVESTTLVDRLLQLFVDGLEAISEADSVVQTHSNVAFGYLCVLLCTLCLDDEARSYLRASVKDRSLDRLLGTVEEFLHYHRKVEEELRDVRWEEDAMAGFTSRLQGIVDRIREAEG